MALQERQPSKLPPPHQRNGTINTSMIDSSTQPRQQQQQHSLTVPIDEIEVPTIDAVLNRVPLVYDPVRKCLLLKSACDNTLEPVRGVRYLNRKLQQISIQNGLSKPSRATSPEEDERSAYYAQLNKNGAEFYSPKSMMPTLSNESVSSFLKEDFHQVDGPSSKSAAASRVVSPLASAGQPTTLSTTATTNGFHHHSKPSAASSDSLCAHISGKTCVSMQEFEALQMKVKILQSDLRAVACERDSLREQLHSNGVNARHHTHLHPSQQQQPLLNGSAAAFDKELEELVRKYAALQKPPLS